MGTTIRIVLFASDEQAAIDAAEAAFTRMAEIDQTLSDYKEDSELSRLSDAPAGTAVRVSEDLWRVLSYAQGLSARTDGAFDITIGPLVQLWRLTRERGMKPLKVDLDFARSRVGWRSIQLDEQARTATLTGDHMQLDAGGIGKGDAGDQAAIVLRERGINSFLIDLGGDLVLGDAPPVANRDGWNIRITPEETQQLANCAVATSGDAYQYTEIDGVRYSHIVNPRTGLGLTHQLTVTVIAPTGIQADALASAVSVLGRTQGQILIDSIPGVAEARVFFTEQ